MAANVTSRKANRFALFWILACVGVKWVSVAMVAYALWVVSINWPTPNQSRKYWDTVQVGGVVLWRGRLKFQGRYLVDEQGRRVNRQGEPIADEMYTEFDGQLLGWYRNGVLEESGSYPGGNGVIQVTWWENGNPRGLQVWAKNGVYISWYESGAMRSYEEWDFVTPHGVSKEWTEDGRLIRSETFVHGERQK